MLLAGDIGGTKTNLAIYSLQTGPRVPLAEATFPSGRYPSLEALVREFLEQTNLPVKHASFGVAGPVVGGQATITNLPWIMAEGQLEEALKLSSVRLFNDLAAIAHAVPFLVESADLYILNLSGDIGCDRAWHRPGGSLPHLGWNALPCLRIRRWSR